MHRPGAFSSPKSRAEIAPAARAINAMPQYEAMFYGMMFTVPAFLGGALGSSPSM
jgi:hypothetical protein